VHEREGARSFSVFRRRRRNLRTVGPLAGHQASERFGAVPEEAMAPRISVSAITFFIW
jgi:hypothetical protein